jgi:hypothetical protein
LSQTNSLHNVVNRKIQWRVFLLPWSWDLDRGLPLIVWAIFALCISGCASQSSLTAASLDPHHPSYKTPACQDKLGSVWIHQDIKNTSMVSAPVIVLAAGPVAAIPVMLAHLGLGTMDRMDAADLAQRCGGEAPSNLELAGRIAGDAALGLATGGASNLVGKAVPAVPLK